METDNFRRHAAVPKRARTRRAPRPLPTAPHELSWLAGTLGDAERRAMREIVQFADVITVNGHKFLLAPVSDKAIDALASFEIEAEDRELEEDACPAGDDAPLPEGRTLWFHQDDTDAEPALGWTTTTNQASGTQWHGFNDGDRERDRCDDEPGEGDEPDHDNEALHAGFTNPGTTYPGGLLD